MRSTKHLIAVAFVLTATSVLSAADWCGFHGLEKEGRGDSTTGPLNWSSSQNVVWKTAIPGRGHSSAIVSGDVVYLTTAYQRSRLSAVQKVWKHALFVLSVLFTMVAIGCVFYSLGASQKVGAIWQHVRVFMSTVLLWGVVFVVFFGFYLLNLDDDPMRAWLVSIMVMLSCLILSLLFVPLRSRRLLLAGFVSVAFTVPAFITLKSKDAAFALGSLKGLISIVALLLPIAVGLALFMAYFVGRKREREMIRGLDDIRPNRRIRWRFLLTGGAGLFAALAAFFLFLYRAADYQIPDSVVWHNRFRPDVSWWCIGLYAIFVLVTVGFCFCRLVRGSSPRRFLLQKALFVLALGVGTAFFVDVNFVERPVEFIRAVVCLDRDSGETLWTCEGLLGQTKEAESRTVTNASATPVTDGESIYGYFGKDGLMCVSLEGKLLWKKTEPMFHSKFGVGTSPVVKDNVLIVVSDERESDRVLSSIAAFDCLSGERLWEKERKSHKVDAGYSTPLIKSLNGREVVIVHGWYDIRGYDLKSGEELWSYPMAHEGRHLVASLVSDLERVYITGYEQITALALSKLGTGSDPLLWSTGVPGEKSSTPVVVDGLLFLVTETGTAFCLDAKTGEVLWKKRLEGRYFSSVVATANRVFFTNESGQTTVVASDREFRPLAKNSMGESVYASFVPTGNELFVRTTRHVYCIQEEEQQGSSLLPKDR